MKKILLKRSICLVLILGIIFTGGINVSAKDNFNFEDVKNYYPFNSWAVDTGIKYSFIFLENNTRQTSRKEVANIICNIVKLKEKDNGGSVFSDLNDIESKYKKSIEMVAENGILKGYGDGTFRPNQNITRAEFVTILDRLGIFNNNYNINIDFNDINTHWAKASIIKAASSNIVAGKGNNKFCPEETITPQEIFVILDRLVSSNLITKDNLLAAMLNTFKCKVYGEEERYIAEEIYGNFDEIQNKIIYSWPYEKYYDPTDWQTLATYEDLQYAIYFSSTNYTNIYSEGETKTTYDNVIKASYLMQGVEADNSKYGKNNFLLKNLFRAIKSISGNTRNFNPKLAYSVYFLAPDFYCVNKDEFEEEDIISVKTFLYESYKDENFIVNGYQYLPLDAPVTKYMLNYFIDRMREHNMWSKSTVTHDKFEFETNPNNFPSNYKDYPYIIKGIPKQAYEKPLVAAKYAYQTHTPKDCYIYNYGSDMANIVERTNNYFNSLVNVNYQNTDFNEYKKTMMYNSYFTDYEELDEYIKYVKDNHIVIKGKATTIPGSIVIAEPLCSIRLILEFEIVNSDTNKDLLYKDAGYNVTYEKNKFYYIVDAQLTAGWSKEGFTDYSPFAKPLFENLDISEVVPIGGVYIVK